MSMDITEIVDFTVTRGDTFSFRFSMVGEDEEDITPDAAFFSVRKTSESSDYIFQKSLTNGGITLLDTSQDATTQLYTKTYKVRVAPADTATLYLGKYVYDLELTFDSDVFTRLKGNYILTYDVTRS